MRVAFKEWAVVIDALGRGEQILIFRKGGIAEDRGGFQVDHPEFLLFPTLFHQQRESVLSSAQERFDRIAPQFPPKSILRLEYFARVAEFRRLDSLSDAERLRGQHVWRDEVIAGRFEWGRARNIFVLALRIYRLPQVVERPMAAAYGGCKSWIALDAGVAVDGAEPVLNDALFARKLGEFREKLAPVPAG